jgi:GntR family transcriptional regulator
VLKQNGIPLYHQLKEIFVEKIVNGEWLPNEVIPNEAELCEEYGVSRGPVRQALQQLVREGLLSRKQGKGTWVLPPKIERGLGGFYSFTTLIEQRGMRATARLLGFEETEATGGVARALSLTPGEPVYKMRRLRLANDEPLILETIYVPRLVCGGLTETQVGAAPLYTILETMCGLHLTRAKQFLEPVVADDYEAKVLGIDEGSPVLLVQNTTYAAADRPVVLSKAIVRGDRVRYYAELEAEITA